MMHGTTNIKLCRVIQSSPRPLPLTLFPINHSSIILPFEAAGCVNSISTQNTGFGHDKWVLGTMTWRFLGLRMMQTQNMKVSSEYNE